jgi:hypothetical protein
MRDRCKSSPTSSDPSVSTWNHLYSCANSSSIVTLLSVSACFLIQHRCRCFGGPLVGQPQTKHATVRCRDRHQCGWELVRACYPTDFMSGRCQCAPFDSAGSKLVLQLNAVMAKEGRMFRPWRQYRTTGGHSLQKTAGDPETVMKST